MIIKIFNNIIDEMNSMEVSGQPNLVRIYSCTNFVVTTTILVMDALTSNRLVA
jgi:hypothetical protein